jgi:ABC-2 type transport system ATP-binding protein
VDILKIEGISKRYGATQAVRNLSLNIEKGSVYGILGPNGSGKTTILGIILGVIHQNSGNFQWAQANENDTNFKIGALLETPNFYSYLNLSQNLELVAKIKQTSIDHVDTALEKLGLLERKYSRYYTLSLGMKQRLAIASALLGDPEILVFDEPTNGLDPEGIADVRRIITNEAANGKTIILASHILSEVQKTCTHVAILKKGEIIKSGEMGSLMKSKKILIVSSENNELLNDLLVRSGLFNKIEQDNNEIHIELKENQEAKDVNEFAFKNDIILTKFETKEQSLETEFLKIINS